jgi:hypothetical protein
MYLCPTIQRLKYLPTLRGRKMNNKFRAKNIGSSKGQDYSEATLRELAKKIVATKYPKVAASYIKAARSIWWDAPCDVEALIGGKIMNHPE